MEIKVNIEGDEAEHLSPRLRHALEEVAAALCEPGTDGDDVTGFRFEPGKGPLIPGPIIAGPPVVQFCISRSTKDGGSCGVYIASDQDNASTDSCTIEWR